MLIVVHTSSADVSKLHIVLRLPESTVCLRRNERRRNFDKRLCKDPHSDISQSNHNFNGRLLKLKDSISSNIFLI